MTPFTPAAESFRACSSTRSSTGMYGNGESSHELHACTFATTGSPLRFAASQYLSATSPGPTWEIE